MRDVLCELWTNQSVRYLAASAFGFILAVVAQQVSTHFHNQALRRSVREGLAQELATNLFVLDEYLDTLRKNVVPGQYVWPLGTLESAILARCLDPSVNAVLTEIERVQSAVALQQCRELAGAMEISREEMHADRNRAHLLSRTIISYHLPTVGQTFNDLLCKVLMEQQVFASTRSATMAHRLLPLYKANALSSDRTWRTFTIPDSHWRGPFMLAWRHDDPQRTPKNVHVIELAPPEGSYRIVSLGELRWHRRLLGKPTRWIQQRRLERSIERIGKSSEGRRPPIRTLKEPTDSSTGNESS